jgi:hypothetical protein
MARRISHRLAAGGHTLPSAEESARNRLADRDGSGASAPQVCADAPRSMQTLRRSVRSCRLAPCSNSAAAQSSTSFIPPLGREKARVFPPLPPGSSPTAVKQRARSVQLNEARGFIRLIKENWLATLVEAENMAENCKCNCKEITARFECGEMEVPGYSSPAGILVKARDVLSQAHSTEAIGNFPPNQFSNLKEGQSSIPVVPSCGTQVKFKCANSK